jgi:hypothetical protein
LALSLNGKASISHQEFNSSIEERNYIRKIMPCHKYTSGLLRTLRVRLQADRIHKMTVSRSTAKANPEKVIKIESHFKEE